MDLQAISDVFRNPRTGLFLSGKHLQSAIAPSSKSANALLDVVKKSQPAAQQTAGWKRPKANQMAPTGGTIGSYQGDVIFFRDDARANHGFIAIFTLINANSRYAYARGLKAVTAFATSAAMVSIIEENDDDNQSQIAKLWVDNGSEFKSDFAQLCKHFGINLHQAEAKTHYKLARVDRFHRTLRMLLGRLFIINGNRKWAEHLQDIIGNYNDHQHRGLDDRTPKEVDVDEEESIRVKDRAKAAVLNTRNTANHKISVGMRARYLTNRWDVFKKGSDPVWSKPVKVLAQVGINTFLLDAKGTAIKLWPEHSLQPVHIETLISQLAKRDDGPSREVIRAERRARREISEADILDAIGGIPLESLGRGKRAPKPQSIWNPSTKAQLSKKKEQKVFEVERIEKHRKRKGKYEYFVKWVDYPSSENTWEPIEHFTNQSIIKKYWNKSI